MDLKGMYDSVTKNVGGAIAGSLSSLYVKPQQAVASPVLPTQYHLKDRDVKITDADMNAIRPLLYGELSNRTPDKQALEANVILNTAINRAKEYARKGQNKSIAQIIAMPNQYQAYGGPQYKQYANPVDAPSIAKKKQVDAIVDSLHGQIRSGVYPDNTKGSYYYIHNPDGTITYDNEKPLFAN